MYVAPGLLDQRLTFYERQNSGADGFVRPVYVQTGVYWGRVDAMSSAFTVAGSPQAHIDARTTLTATVAEYVAVDPFGIIKVENDAKLYHVRGVYAMRQMSGQQIALEQLTPEESAAFVTYEPAEVLDGYHYGKLINGFSTGFDTGYA
jgi:hypothetical protein